MKKTIHHSYVSLVLSICIPVFKFLSILSVSSSFVKSDLWRGSFVWDEKMTEREREANFYCSQTEIDLNTAPLIRGKLTVLYTLHCLAQDRYILQFLFKISALYFTYVLYNLYCFA